MANYKLDPGKAITAMERIEASSKQIDGLLQKYTQAKQHLLSTWEGSMKDLFIQQTGQSFEYNCQVLINGLKQLTADIQQTSGEIIKRHINAGKMVK